MPIAELEDILRIEAKRFVYRCHKISHSNAVRPDAEQVTALHKRLNAERELARAQSFRYDPNRHIALLQRLKAWQQQKKGASRQGHA